MPKNPLLSRERIKALKASDAHFSAEDKNWESFVDHAARKSFVKAVQRDPRADEKLKRHVDALNRLKTGKPLGSIHSSTKDKDYQIIRLRGGGLGCTCPDWRYRQSVSTGDRMCKHVKAFKSKGQEKTAAVYTSQGLLARIRQDKEALRKEPSTVPFAEKTAAETASFADVKPGDVVMFKAGPRHIMDSRTAQTGEDAYRLLSPRLQGGLTHAAISLGKDRVVESTDMGVRIRPLWNGPDFVVLRPNSDPSARERAAAFAKQQIGKSYDIKAMVGAGAQLITPVRMSRILKKLAKSSPETAQQFQCGGLVAGAYLAAGSPLETPTHWAVTAPAHLLASPSLHVVAKSQGIAETLAVPLLPMYRKALTARRTQILKAPVLAVEEPVALSFAEKTATTQTPHKNKPMMTFSEKTAEYVEKMAMPASLLELAGVGLGGAIGAATGMRTAKKNEKGKGALRGAAIGAGAGLLSAAEAIAVEDAWHRRGQQVARVANKVAEVEYRGKTFPGYNVPIDSSRPEKKKMVLAKDGGRVRLIHFGQKGYRHNYSEAAKKNYLARSAGIKGKGGLTKDDKFSANYWARRELWPTGEPADGSARDKSASVEGVDFQEQKELSKNTQRHRRARSSGTLSSLTGAFSRGGRYSRAAGNLSKNTKWYGKAVPLTQEELLAEAEKPTTKPIQLRAIHDALRRQGHPGIASLVPEGYRGKLDGPQHQHGAAFAGSAASLTALGLNHLVNRGNGAPADGLAVRQILGRLRANGIAVREAGLRNSYSPTTHTVFLKENATAATLAHEAGHALARHSSRLRHGIQKLDLAIGRRGAPTATALTLGAAPLLQDTSLEERPEERTKQLARYRALLGSAAALQLPTLMEEGAATAHGAHMVAQAEGARAGLKTLARLTPAFGTYAGAAAIPALAAFAVHQKMHPEKYSNRRMLFFNKRHSR